MRHDSEVCWAMWLLWEIEAVVEDAAKTEIERMNNGIVATMALFLEDKAKFRGSIDTRFWEGTAGHHAFQGHLWLLAYEGSKRGWLPIKGKDLDAFNIANLLHEQNVSFLDERAKLEPIFEKMPRIKVGAMRRERIGSR